MNLEQQILDDLFFLVFRFCLCPIASFFELVAFVNEQGSVPAIIDHQLWAFTFQM